MSYRHSHPINIVEHIARFLILLLFPVLRAFVTLLFTGMDFYKWLQGAWFDILTVMLIIFMGFVTWFRYVYRLDENGIRIRQGILITKCRFLPYKNISVLSLERPFYLLSLIHI